MCGWRPESDERCGRDECAPVNMTASGSFYVGHLHVMWGLKATIAVAAAGVPAG